MRRLSSIVLSILCYAQGVGAGSQLEDIADCANKVFICPRVEDEPAARFVLETGENGLQITFQSGADEQVVPQPSGGTVGCLIKDHMQNRNVGDIFVYFDDWKDGPLSTVPDVHFMSITGYPKNPSFDLTLFPDLKRLTLIEKESGDTEDERPLTEQSDTRQDQETAGASWFNVGSLWRFFFRT